MDKREQEFDAGIRQKLSEGSIDFDEKAWGKMEQRLTGRKGRKVLLPRWGRAAAAVLLAGLGIWIYLAYFANQSEQTPMAGTVVTPPPPGTGITPGVPRTEAPRSGPRQEPGGSESQDPAADEGDQRIYRGGSAASDLAENRQRVPMERVGGATEIAGSLEIRLPHPLVPSGNDSRVVNGDFESLILSGSGGTVPPESRDTEPFRSADLTAGEEQPDSDQRTASVDPDEGDRDGVSLSLSVLAAPDLNGVRGIGGGKVGFNAGVGLGVHFSERLSLHTGIVYSKKPYDAAPSDYHTGYSPQGLMNIAADCEVIDIPLNLRYTLLRKGRNRVSVHAGLSSYLMLREQYRYEFGADDPRDYEYRNENQHLMGVGNAGVLLERELGGGLSLGLKPFVKVPLTGIGHGDVRLVSAGAALQLNLEIGKKK